MTPKLIHRSVTLLSALSLGIALTAGPVRAETFKLLMSWDRNNVNANFAYDTLHSVAAKLSNGSIDVKRFGPEIVPPFEQLQPVSSGTFDMLYTHPAYHGGATAVGSLIDTITPDSEMRHSTGIWDWLDTYYQKNFNMKMLAISPATGYQFLLKEPLKGGDGLNGRKIRSNPAYDPLIKSLGGAPVLLPVPQIFTSLQKGLIDGSAYTVNSLVNLKFYEVVKYMARPTFGGSNTFIMMNLKKWQSLDSKTQDVMKAAAKKVEDGMPWFAQKEQLEDEQGMIVNGARYTYFETENAARLTRLFDEGLWAQAVRKSGAPAQELVDLIKAKGMVNR